MADERSRLSALDGVRAIAVMMVLVFHLTSMSGFPLDALGPLATPVVHGWMGVDVFFALSGYLITRLWLEEEKASAETAGTRTRHFYARRALRILPIYYVTLFGFLLLAKLVRFPSVAPFAARVSAHPTKLLPYVFFFANYVGFGRDGAFAARWSLCVEEHFYLLWPLLLLFVRKRRARVGVAVGVCVALLVARTVAVLFKSFAHGWGSPMMVRYASHLRLDAILWGCVVALLHDELVRAPRVRRAVLAASIAAVVALVWTGEITVLRAPQPFGGGAGTSILAIAAAMFCVEIVAAPRSLVARALAAPPLPTIGFHSYAMYLIHPIAIDLADALVFRGPEPYVWRWLLAIVVAVVLALIGALALHVIVDRPFRKLRARFRASAQLAS